MINFLVEISIKSNNIIHPTPTNNYNKQFNIYEININPIEKTYWTDWGGTYDHFIGTQIELYYSQFLQKVNNENELEVTPFSLYITNENIVLINIPKHPWLYPDYSTENEEVIPFLSSSLNPDKPSNNIIREVNAKTRLEIPNFSIKLSDSIAGITLNQGYSITLYNNDGYFDDEEKWNLLNTPLHLKKSIGENPSYTDFKTIRTGLIENVSTDFENIQIDVSDKFKSLNEPICNVIIEKDYPNVIIDDKAIGKNIPVLYGTKKIKLIKLNDNNYVAAEYISNISGVYDNENNEISFNYDNISNIIKTVSKADYAIVTGYTENKIGEIIKDLVTRKSKIQYNNSNWNIDELSEYINYSSKINIVFNSGDIKKAIQDILKNDLAYFIQQVDGRFTIRQYGKDYNVHLIPSWSITKKPDKTWASAQENYFSSCILNYDYTDDEDYKSYLYNERENESENKYRKITRKTFNTDLIYKEDVEKLSKLLSNRYTDLKQTLTIAIGIDTSEFELLDMVILDTNINDRKFINTQNYIIKEINPAQDILTLETINIKDITGEYPDTNYYEYDYDNEYAYTTDFKTIIEGGFV